MSKYPRFNFRELHPSATAGHGRRIELTNKYRCKQCGFPVDAKRTQRRSTTGHLDGNVITGTIAGGAFLIQALSGCPHCGTHNWSDRVANTKPRAKDIKSFRGRRFRRNIIGEL